MGTACHAEMHEGGMKRGIFRRVEFHDAQNQGLAKRTPPGSFSVFNRN